MSSRISSKLLLKKVIEQNNVPSKLQSFQSLELLSKRYQPLGQTESLQIKENQKPSESRQQCGVNQKTSRERAQLLEQELKLQSKVQKDIDCLYIESNIISKPVQQPQFMELPLQCLESRIHTQKLKVHSSIDGLEISKQSSNSSQRLKQKSLAISDLIIADHKYMKRSNGLNQHDTFSLAEEEEFLTLQYFENLKILKQQTVEKIQCIERQIELLEKDELIEKLNQKITEIQCDIHKLKFNECASNTNQSRARSKTPEIRRLKSLKSNEIHRVLMSPNHEEYLERNICNEKQKMRRVKEKSINVMEKLSQAKSDYKELQLKLNFYENHLHAISPPSSPKLSSSKMIREKTPLSNQRNQLTLLSPKSPQRVQNYKMKYAGFLQKQKQNYHSTLKQHIMLIFEQIQTFKAYQSDRCDELKEEIELLKNQIRYVDVKSVEKFFFVSPYKEGVHRLSQKQASRDKSAKQSVFQNAYSQKLISTYSSNSLHSAMPPLSPRSPQIHSRSPQLYSRSPNIYSKSPQCSTTITPRSIKIKDMNRASDKSTNHSQTKIQKSKNGSENTNFEELGRKVRKGKQNCDLKKIDSEKVRRKENGHKIGFQGEKNETKTNRKVFTNMRYDGEMRTQPSDEYCINSENQFRF